MKKYKNNLEIKNTFYNFVYYWVGEDLKGRAISIDV